MHTIKLAHGAQLPALGFGTWQIKGPAGTEATLHALNVGYRHIDTAQIYDNEEAVGTALQQFGQRDKIWLTTKVWTSSFGQQELPLSVEESLRKLQTDYVDLLLLHWPNPEIELEETLGALMQVQQRGLAKHIGVSNFPIKLWQEANRLTNHTLVTNQVEYHPFLNQQALVEYAQKNHQALTAYSPLAQGDVVNDAALLEIAHQHRKTPGQVTLRWLLQQANVCAIPRSSNPARIAENFDISDFNLSLPEVARINLLRTQNRRLINPGFAPQWDTLSTAA